MTKKMVIIAGIITLAALAAGAVAFFLLGKTNLFDKWNLEICDDDIDEEL